MKDQLRASVDRLQSAQQECQADVKAFTRSQADVTRGVAKKLPEALASIQARLQEVTVTIEENEESAKENEVGLIGWLVDRPPFWSGGDWNGVVDESIS